MGLLRDALADLAADPSGETENDLNRGLYRALVRASHRAAQTAETAPPVVVPEGRNPPASTDEDRAVREHKIPDLYWAYIDPLVENPNDAAQQFVVECKRLTKPTRGWVYTSEYVDSGVARFVTPEHSYGKGMASGAMVGYLQDIPLDDALREVNTRVATHAMAPLVLSARNGEADADLAHDLIRSFPASPFHLTHVWARMGTFARRARRPTV
ncbi:MAG: hypothetical protein EPO65_13885 [Dehalococcoidia bacterium]|nr:MAG: hypothetical protein EPO65_13885 [Dehalococcoidia bacterium]